MVQARGPSKAAIKASQYLGKNPNVTAQQLADRFGIDVTTVRRSAWWQNRSAAQKKSAE